MSSGIKDEQQLKDEIVRLREEVADAKSHLKGEQRSTAKENAQKLNGPGRSLLCSAKSAN